MLDELQGAKKAEAEKPVPPPAAPKAAPSPSTDKAAEPKAPTPKPAEKAASEKVEAKAAPAKQAADTSVRVDTSRLDEIMNMVGELVLVRNRISTLESSFENEEMAKAVNNLRVVTGDLQTAVMKTRMQPIKKVFGRFPRVVRDIARSLKKVSA